jgi:threonine dehydrogenase-like Zn-dependent dehydrogenase
VKSLRSGRAITSSRRAIGLWCPSPYRVASASSASVAFSQVCERSNPNAEQAAKLWGHSPAGLFGYSHLLGGFPGGQTEYLRVPFVDKVPMGSAINRGLTFRMAQTPVQHYLPKLVKLIEDGKIDPSFVITHRAKLEQGPEMYETFRDKKDGCIKVMMRP